MQLLLKIYSWLSGLFKRANDKDIVRDNNVVAISNFDIHEQGFLQKRLGRDFKSLLYGSNEKITGLIQNETSEGTKELYGIVIGTIYYDSLGAGSSIFTSRSAAGNYHAEYWQNQIFFGAGFGIIGAVTYPEDIIVKEEGVTVSNIYVVDNSDERTQLFKKSDKSFVSGFGTYGTGDLQFDTPLGIAVDQNYMYITDGINDRVQIVDISDNSFVGEFGSTGSGDGQFDTPTGIVVDGAFIYVCDSINDRVQKFDKASPYGFVSKFGSTGIGNGQFDTPQGIAIDGTWIYVVDGGNDRVQAFLKTDNSFVETFGSNGSGNGQFDQPYGIGIDLSFVNRRLYIAENGNSRIQVLQRSGLNGDGALEYANKFGSNGSGNGQFINPTDVKTDKTYIYVVDTGNDRVQVFLKTDNSYSSQFGSDGIGDGEFTSPYALALDPLSEDDRDYYTHYVGSSFKPYVELQANSGSVDASSSYTYITTHTDGTNESAGSPASVSVSTGASGGQIRIQKLSQNVGADITHWNIYRAKSGGNYYKVTSVAIATSEYIDNNAESSINTNVSYPLKSTLYDFLDSAIFTFYQEKLWIIKNKTAYFSDAFKPYYFPAANFIQFDTKDDGTGIHALTNMILIFTANGIHVVDGETSASYSKRILTETVGTIAHRSIQEYMGTAIFLDEDGIYSTDGTREPIKLSDPTINEIIDDIQPDKWGYICSAIYKDRYYLSIPTSSGNDYNDKVLVFDFLRKNWTVYEGWNIHSFAIYEDTNGNPLLYGADTTSGVYQLLITNADDDNAGTPGNITCSFESKHYDLGEPTRRKKVNRFTAIQGGDGSNNVTPTLSWAVGSNAEESMAITVDKVKEITRIRPAGGIGTKFYIKSSETGKQKYNFYGFEVEGQILKKRRID